MIVEFYSLKCFALGAFVTWMTMRKINKRPTTYEIKEI